MDGPAASRTLLTDVANYFDHAPRGAAIETLQKFGIPSGTPFSSFLRSFRAVVALARHGDGDHSHSYSTIVRGVDADFVPG